MKSYAKGQKSKGVMKLIAAILVVGFFTYVAIAGLGKNASGSASDIKLGLDLAGGVSITYQSVTPDPSSTDMKDTVYKLQLRAQTYSTEAEVYQEGADRINVDIPGVSDANAILEELGQPGSLEFRTEDGEVVLTGVDIKNAQEGMYKNQSGNTEYVVQLTLNEEGAEKFAKATEENINKRISIIYDGKVVSSPQVKSAITGGEAQIDQISSYEEATTLASTIRIGALPLELKEIRSNVVGAKLGEEAISTSLLAGAIGMGLVMIFMICLYFIPGLAASIALTLYTALMVFLLSAYQITLTLPGIAGIVLSIGMAVDANVIIFSRIKEELLAGKTVESAMKEGFSKALSAIVDGNVTTLIAAGVLYWMGSGTVKGFAQTLALGILLSMFTALVVTRFVLKALYQAGIRDPKFYGLTKRAKNREFKVINFLGKKNICFICSAVVILVGVGALIFNSTKGTAFNYSLEFRGGTSTNVTFNEDLSLNQISSDVVPLISEVTGDNDIQTQKVAGTNQVIIKSRTLSVEEREQITEKLVDKYGVDGELITAESISATVSNEMKQDAVLAVAIATVAMLIYIWLRFKDIKFATSAVIALIHDVLVVLTFYAVARWSVGNTFIACMLTIVGYSINATIVIFDRIRENLKQKKGKEDIADVVNLSITQTLTRSINTSLTTFIMVFVLFLLGVSSIRDFALPLIVGIVCGAYSSVCITGALWYIMTKKFVKKAD